MHRATRLLLTLILLPAGANAQHPRNETVECRGQPISAIHIETRMPFTPGPATFVTRTAQVVRRLHATTRPSVVRRYLALAEGRPCTELRRTESERILRAQPFIADASVAAFPDGPDSVSIYVTTIDELSPILDGSLSGSSPHFRSLRVGNANLLGSGTYGAVNWRDGNGFRDEYGLRLVHYQLLGRPYQLEMNLVRRIVGHDVYIEASHPYLTELQRIAWRTHYGVSDSFTRFLRGTDTAAWLPVRQNFGDVGGVVRIGGPGLLALVGGSISQERDRPGSWPVVLDRGTIRSDTSSELIGRYQWRRQTRVNALLGVRDLRFLRVTGFESLDGVQDIPKGFQFSGLIGRGMPMLDGRSDRGVFASSWLYGGFGSATNFVALDAGVEARRENEERAWVGLIASTRAGAYLKPYARHTFVPSVEWTGGWKSRVPFQLTLADAEGGLRGLSGSRIGGGQRLVVRLEDRYHLGRFRRYGTFGVAAFTDAGRLWAGDAPFGMDSKVSASIGVGLLASVPPRSQRLMRFDVAYPISSDGRRRLEGRLTVRSAVSLVWREPRDVRQAREQSVPANVFNWP
jgi:hypothetical protein